ncbi:diguanylate cyclase domain-containing protein [Pseudoduganella violacea]|uniref:Diguanylate cyclase (GGDEF)-like protein/PAS domain S-box-containing protein n=1 Tax=Pseudoduganella violacea TaxID=1715466 RepID=A0A7W5BFR4_9BURK|nr:diguanylate cyclase [Pseudoduganella violacea]MBB3121455.1 diguanylate cyclase (GGDEF)-like protein/PAS domain S-box-containing protein [Pseudoduganella violacea]
MAMTGFLPRSLKFRLTSFVVVLVLAATSIVTTLALTVAERDMKGVIGSQQINLLSGAAAFIDEQLKNRLNLLAALAESLPEAARRDPEALRQALQTHATVSAEFTNVVAFGRDGELVASLRDSGLSRSLNVSSRPYFLQTLSTKRAVIAPPLRSRLSNLPVVLITQPLLDKKGEVQFVLAGSIDLLHSDFFQQFDLLRPGKTGYLYVMTSDGVIVNHPDKSRLLGHVASRSGTDQATEKALAGFEGWTEAESLEGDGPGIYTFKRLASTNWIAAARYPTSEAFAPMKAMRQQAILLASVCAALAGLLAWLMVLRFLRPLETLRAHLGDIRHGHADLEALHVGAKDEIGELGAALVEDVRERDAALRQLEASEKRARLIADNIPALISYIDKDLRYRFTNEHYQFLLGVDPKSLLGRTVNDVFGGEVDARWRDCMEAALAGQRVHVEREGEELGRYMHLMVDMVPDFAPDGSVPGFYVMANDITERKMAELTQAASQKRLQLITDHLPALVSAIGPDHRFQFGNAAFQRWLGVDPNTLPGRPVVDAIGEAHYAIAKPCLDRAFQGEVTSYEAKAKVGEESRILASTLIPDLRQDGSVAAVYVLTSDMTHVKAVEEQLIELARRDTLTGIANRRMFEETLQQALDRARRRDSPLALAYLDIDHFKSINDTLGHGAGDDVLKEFAMRLTASVRSTDTVARLAGDEFAIVFENVLPPDEATTLAERIVGAIRPAFNLQTGMLPVTCSVGIAVHAGPGENPAGLLARADAALYDAKRNGRNGYVVDERPAGPRPVLNPAANRAASANR